MAEYLFVKLGIYEQHWWRYYMSAIVVVAFLVISKMWFKKMTRIQHGLTRNITFYFAALIVIHLPFPLLLLFGKQHYSVDLLENIVHNMYRSSTIFNFIYHLVECFIWVYFVCILNKWFWKLAPFVISLVVQFILMKMNILIFQDSWNLFYTMLFYAISLIVFILLNKYTLIDKERTDFN
jgi:hypothetical protein